MNRNPTLSTIFPYSTLFRSMGLKRHQRETAVSIKIKYLLRLGNLEWIAAHPVHYIPPRRHAAQAIVGTPSLDRKSTRLNSSHLVISYAVFCLKKKTNTTSRN